MAVSVGPFKRIVDVYFPNDEAFLVVQFRYCFYETSINEPCDPPTQVIPTPPPYRYSVIGGAKAVTQLMTSKYVQDTDGIVAIMQGVFDLPLDNYTWEGTPSLGGLGEALSGGSHENIIYRSDPNIGEGANYYSYIEWTPISPPEPSFPKFNKPLSFNWFADTPTLVQPICYYGYYDGEYKSLVRYLYDSRGTLPRSVSYMYRTVIGAVPVDFSGFSLTEKSSGRVFNSLATYFEENQDTGISTVFVLCKYTTPPPPPTP